MQSNDPTSGLAQPQLAGDVSRNELEFAKLQLAQALDTYRTQMTLLVQILTVMVIADCTVVGYSLANKNPMSLAVGCIFHFFMLYTLLAIQHLSIPILYTAVNIEQAYGTGVVDGVATSFLSFTSSPEYVGELRKIANDYCSCVLEERIMRLRALPRPRLGVRGHLVRKGLIAIGLGQIIAATVLHLVLHWPVLGSR